MFESKNLSPPPLDVFLNQAQNFLGFVPAKKSFSQGATDEKSWLDTVRSIQKNLLLQNVFQKILDNIWSVEQLVSSNMKLSP